MKKIYEEILTSTGSDSRAFPGIRQRLVIFSVFFLGFLFAVTQQANAAVLGMDRASYGVWDREGGHPVGSYPYTRGQSCDLSWGAVNTARSNFTWTALDSLLQTADAQNQMFTVKVSPIDGSAPGDSMPTWMFTSGVPKIICPSYTYGYYLDPEFTNYFSEMVIAFAKHVRQDVASNLQSRIAFVRVDTGCTGDEQPYEGTDVSSVPSQYRISAQAWQDYRLWVFELYRHAFQDGPGPVIPLLFQSVEPPQYQVEWDWVSTNIVGGVGIKHGSQLRGYHLSESESNVETWKPLAVDSNFKFFSRNEMDQTWKYYYFQLNLPLTMYWTALEQLNVGMSIWDWSGTALEAAASSNFVFTATLFNTWAAELDPATARGGFCVFHEGLDSSDAVKFPKAQYGNWPVNQGSTNRYTAICAAYSNQGARMDHLEGATWGSVKQRNPPPDGLNGFNDSGWQIHPGNYDRFITQINPTNESLAVWRVRGTLTTSSHPYDRFARRSDRASNRNAMYFDVNDSLTPTPGQSIKLSVIYLDKGTNQFGLLYDAVSNSQKSAFTVTKADSNTWKTNSCTVTDWVFNNNGLNGSDLALTNITGDTTFNSIELVKQVDVTLNTVGRGAVSARNDATVYSPVSGTYATGLRLEMTVTPAAGATFTGWSGDLSGSNSRAIFFPTNVNTQVTANFIDTLYTLTVNNGSGSGSSYTNAQQVVIAASNAPSGKVFNQWTGNASYVADFYAPTTTVTISWNTSMTATYRDITYALTVNNGFGGGSYTNGRQVAISAGYLTGKAFVQWIGDTQYVNNVTYTNATVTMSTNPVTLTATYVDVYYALTVNNGTGGGGTYTNGTQVNISADAPAIGKAFYRWTGNTAYVANSNSASTTVTMPAQAIALTATYVDVYYALTVTGGTGGGSYTNGRQVAISANAPTIGKAFDKWIGDTQYVASASSASTTVTMPAQAITLTATYVDVYYPLTINSGSGSGSYTNGTQVAISADAPATGKAFDQWTGDTQYLNDVTYTNALVTMSTNPVSLTATYVDVLYTLTVTGGSGSGSSYTNTQVVEISADAPASGMTFDQWTGDTQYVAGVSSSNTTVTMPAQAVDLSATYKILPGYYTLTVSNGTGGGIYSNGVQVLVTAVAPEGKAFDRWTGDTQIASGVFSLNTIVTMPAQDAALTASCVDVSNGVASVEWIASAGFYFDADPNVGILGDATGNSTIAQLMYSPDNAKDDILPGKAGAVNDVVWDTIILTENGVPGDYDDYAYFVAQNCTRVFTNGYVYALIFQDNQVQPGDWYYSTPLLAIDTNTTPQSIEMNTDTMLGDPIDGANGAQVAEAQAPAEVVLTVNSGSGSGSYTNGQQVAISANAPASGKLFDKWTGDTQYVNNVTYTNALVTMSTNAVSLTATYKDIIYTLTANGSAGGSVSPASTNVVYGGSASFAVTASNYYRIATLTTNGTAVTGVMFDNNSTTTNFIWSNVQTSGVLVATFTAQVTTNAPAPVPYWWLAQYGFTTNNPPDPNSDLDGDGLKLWQEYIAGTDPTNVTSCLKAVQNNRNVITWSPVSGRVYSVYWSTNLVKGFTMKQDNILYPTNSYTNATPDSRVNHYQIKVRMQ